MEQKTTVVDLTQKRTQLQLSRTRTAAAFAELQGVMQSFHGTVNSQHVQNHLNDAQLWFDWMLNNMEQTINAAATVPAEDPAPAPAKANPPTTPDEPKEEVPVHKQGKVVKDYSRSKAERAKLMNG